MFLWTANGVKGQFETPYSLTSPTTDAIKSSSTAVSKRDKYIIGAFSLLVYSSSKSNQNLSLWVFPLGVFLGPSLDEKFSVVVIVIEHLFSVYDLSFPVV